MSRIAVYKYKKKIPRSHLNFLAERQKIDGMSIAGSNIERKTVDHRHSLA